MKDRIIELLEKLYPMETCACEECGGGRGLIAQEIVKLVEEALPETMEDPFGEQYNIGYNQAIEDMKKRLGGADE